MTTRATYLEAERIRNERERMARDLAEIELRQNATPQTLRRRRIVVIDELFTRDRLSVEQLRAGREILGIVTEITRGLQAKTSSYAGRVDTSHREEDWRPGLSRAYQERYIPWRDEAGRMSLRSKTTVADLVLDVCIGNLGINQTAQLWGMHHDRALRILRESLHRYAEIGGWVEARRDVAGGKLDL